MPFDLSLVLVHSMIPLRFLIFRRNNKNPTHHRSSQILTVHKPNTEAKSQIVVSKNLTSTSTDLYPISPYKRRIKRRVPALTKMTLMFHSMKMAGSKTELYRFACYLSVIATLLTYGEVVTAWMPLKAALCIRGHCSTNLYHMMNDQTDILTATQTPTTAVTTKSRRDFIAESTTTTVTSIATGVATSLLSQSSFIASAADQVVEVEATIPSLPSSAIALPAMGLGAWAWGDALFWGCMYREIGNN